MCEVGSGLEGHPDGNSESDEDINYANARLKLSRIFLFHALKYLGAVRMIFERRSLDDFRTIGDNEMWVRFRSSRSVHRQCQRSPSFALGSVRLCVSSPVSVDIDKFGGMHPIPAGA
jgi:hypothetical protein